MSVADKCVPMALIGPNAIQAWRDMLGATDPAKAAMGTLRGDHGNPEIMAENVAHGSDSREAAERNWRSSSLLRLPSAQERERLVRRFELSIPLRRPVIVVYQHVVRDWETLEARGLPHLVLPVHALRP